MILTFPYAVPTSSPYSRCSSASHPNPYPNPTRCSYANADLFSALTLLICLGTSFLTSLCGLSLALGAFLAGLLIAETDFALQVWI